MSDDPSADAQTVLTRVERADVWFGVALGSRWRAMQEKNPHVYVYVSDLQEIAGEKYVYLQDAAGQSRGKKTLRTFSETYFRA